MTGAIIFEYEKENNTMADTVNELIRVSKEKEQQPDLCYADLSCANLRYANLRYADLRYADLRSANLSYADLRSANLSYADLRSANLSYADLRSADLRYADLSYADLRYADLRSADLRYADLSYADLRSIKNDFWAVLLHGLPEIQFLKKNIIEGKIDGSTYDGECACLSGTLFNGAKIHNGEKEKVVTKNILDCRDSLRPAEMFFLCIKKGDTPEMNTVSKIVLQWLEEFETLISFKPF
jgi:uncharacterized protein YjbI with pentapeptide repeats